MKKSITSFCAVMVSLASGVVLSSSGASALTVQECSTKYNAAKAAGTLAGKTWNDFRKAECGDASEAVAAPAAGTVFPTAVSSKYASEKASKARMHTCLDQYKTNKVSNGNGGLKWIMKGGGYYSECNKRLKGVKA